MGYIILGVFKVGGIQIEDFFYIVDVVMYKCCGWMGDQDLFDVVVGGFFDGNFGFFYGDMVGFQDGVIFGD